MIFYRGPVIQSRFFLVNFNGLYALFSTIALSRVFLVNKAQSAAIVDKYCLLTARFNISKGAR